MVYIKLVMASIKQVQLLIAKFMTCTDKPPPAVLCRSYSFCPCWSPTHPLWSPVRVIFVILLECINGIQAPAFLVISGVPTK